MITNCEFQNPINIGTTTSPAFVFQNQVCSSTDELLETYDIYFNGTTSKIAFSNTWNSADVILIFSIFIYAVFSIAKSIIKIFVKKYVSINRKNQ